MMDLEDGRPRKVGPGRRLLLGGAALAMVPLSGAAAADYPDKPIKIVLGFAPGGPTDILSRLLADKLSRTLGTPVVVENKVGAGGNIAAAIVAKAPADGYTLLVGGTNYAIGRSWYKDLQFDIEKDLQIVATLSKNANVLVVNPASSFKSLADIVRAAKADPGKLTFASSGAGTVVHLAGEIFKAQQGLDLTHVPYGGAPPAELDVINGRVDLMFDSLATALPFIRDGKMRAIAVTSRERSSYAPDVPSLAELGMADFDVTSWYAVWAPAGVPPAIIERLNRAIGEALTLPDVRERLAALQAEAFPTSVAAARDFERGEIRKWTTAVEKLPPRPQ
ncbi:MAG: tripartite tricarboxylate transporter substrate binding protein [Reyranellaceae bacterium]